MGRMKNDLDRDAEGDRFELLGRLAAGVAHDLNNYLGVADASLAILKRRHEGASTEEDVDLARRAMDRAIRLTRSLVDYVRGAQPSMVEVDLGEVVRHTLEMFGRAVPSGIEVRIDADRAVPRVPGVVADLEQLVLNLVLNACEAMPHGGELVITVCALDRDMVHLEVADTGCGLAVEAAAGDGATSPSHKPGRRGNGLGLGIVRAVCARHNALLCVAARQGGGTSVKVTLATASATA